MTRYQPPLATHQADDKQLWFSQKPQCVRIWQVCLLFHSFLLCVLIVFLCQIVLCALVMLRLIIVKWTGFLFTWSTIKCFTIKTLQGPQFWNALRVQIFVENFSLVSAGAFLSTKILGSRSPSFLVPAGSTGGECLGGSWRLDAGIEVPGLHKGISCSRGVRCLSFKLHHVT